MPFSSSNDDDADAPPSMLDEMTPPDHDDADAPLQAHRPADEEEAGGAASWSGNGSSSAHPAIDEEAAVVVPMTENGRQVSWDGRSQSSSSQGENTSPALTVGEEIAPPVAMKRVRTVSWGESVSEPSSTGAPSTTSSYLNEDERVAIASSEGEEPHNRRRRRSRSSFSSASSAIRRTSAVFRKNGPVHDWWVMPRRRWRRRKCCRWSKSSPPPEEDMIEGYQELVTNDSVFLWSINAIRFAVFADTLNGMVLLPNYALMALPGAHDESFESTEPFGFSSATYFIPMSGLLGMAIAGMLTGKLSDHIGRKPVIVFCMAGSMFGSALKWLLRESFWGFCIANFANGLLSGSLPVALAYVSDIFSSQRLKAKNFTTLVGLYVLGQSTGGILGILMQDRGLFAPLWAGVAIMFTALVVNVRYLVEPGRIKVPAELGDEDDEEEDVPDLPTVIDKSTLVHILIGAFVDIAGSKALFPICMSPLAFETFYRDFVDAGQEPLMTVNAYKWLTVMVSILIVPSSIAAPNMFRKVGLAASCVFGNAITGVVTFALLYIGNIDPPTRATYAGFVSVMYIGFPCTVISQLSISPMLDKLAPLDQRGFVQGTFTTIFNFGIAVAPWLLGLAADGLGTTVALWIGIGLSFAATLINTPLIWKKAFQPVPPSKKESSDKVFADDFTMTDEEEEEYIQKALRGEHVPARAVSAINIRRVDRGEKFIVNHPGSYDRDRDRLRQICGEAKEDLKVLRHDVHRALARINTDPNIAEFIHNWQNGFPDEMEDIHKEIGLWFGDYLKDNGYIGLNPMQNMKMMIIRAFPPINRDGEINVENFEEVLLNLNRVFNKYLQSEMEADVEVRTGLSTLFKRPPRRMAPVG